MSFSGPSIGSGVKAAQKAYEFGRTYIVRPKGKHQATIVWLHGLGDHGGSWSQILETLPLPNIKWICPTAPTRPVSLFGGFPSTAFKFAVGGFSMGAAVALHAAMCYVTSKYANGNPFPANLSAAVGLSGWLPCAKSQSNKLATNEVLNRAASLPILLCHGKVDDVVSYKHGKKSSEVLASSGFRDLSFKSYDGRGHYTYPKEMEDLCKWLKSKLNLGH